MAEAIPGQIGRYKILDELGRGGFGRVYRGFDPSVGRHVAIKILTEATRDVLSRFRKEATVAGNLRHKNIVTVYEYGEHEGKPFLAMEYLKGQTLQQVIKSRQPLTLLEKCKIMLQVAEGLNSAHRSGIVHRDVKPANIMLMPDGIVKIMDFGIARVMEDRDGTLTQQGFLVGTIQYMSPEQFSGTARADALCDIFAFGVIFYELATGIHPFEGHDSRILMYKISFEEPPPIRALVPDFPYALQEVVNKALKKDRDLRYQSLTAAVFDLEPIRLDLERQRAEELLIVAEKHFADRHLEQAQSVVLEALGFDPSNRAARSLWDNVQRQLQRLALQPRIESLLRTGEENLAQRRFAEAAQNFEAALRLDANDVRVQERLEYSRDCWNRSLQAASLLAESRTQFSQENITAAYRLVSDALRQDPTRPEAREFQKEIEAAIERHLRDRRITEATQKAEDLLSLNSFDQAAAALTGLGTDAETPAVKQLLDRIQAAAREEQRSQKLRSGTAFATQCLREGNPEDAVLCLENLRNDFPESSEVDNLLSYARKELEAERKAKAIQEVSAEVRTLISEKNFDAALSSIERRLAAYPGESHLTRLRSSTIAAKDDFDREQSIEAATNKCEELRLRHRFAEAIECVEATLRDYPGEVRLSKLLQQLELQWEQHRREQAVRKAAERAGFLLSKQQPEVAIPLLQQTLAKYRDEPALIELLTHAQEEVKTRQRLQAINAVREETVRFIQANAFDSAFAAIDRALEIWPEDPNLITHRQEVVAKKREFERQRAIGDFGLRSRHLLGASQFQEATNLILAACREFPDEPSLIQLAGEIADEWQEYKRRESIREITTDCRVLISRGRLDEGIALLEEGLASYPGESELTLLMAEAHKARESRERAAAVLRITAQSRELTKQGQFQGAIQLLEEGLQKYPADSDFTRELSSVVAARTAWERIAAIDASIQTARHLAAGKRFEEARDLLDLTLKNVGSEPALLETRAAIEQEFVVHQRNLNIERIVLQAKRLLDEHRPDEALNLLRDGASRYAGESEWPPLIRGAEQEIADRKRAEERTREIRRVETSAKDLAGKQMFDVALELVARALETYPQDPDLDLLQSRLNAAAEAHKHAEAVKQTAAQIEFLIGKGQFENAFDRLNSSKEQYPGEAVFDVLLSQAQSLFEAQQRRDTVACEAEARIEDGQFGQAVTLLEKALAEFPGDAVLASALARAREQETARQEREKAIGRAIVAARALAKERRFAEALEGMDAALQQFGQTPALDELRGEMRMRKALTDAETLIAQSKPADALNIIQKEASGFLNEPDVVAVIQRAREQRIAQERSAAVAEQVQQARRKAQTDLDGALILLEEGLRKWPDAEPLIEIRKDLLAAKSTRERQKAIDEAVRQCEQEEKEKGREAALKVARVLLRKFDHEPALLAITGRIEKELLEKQKRERWEGDLSELRTIADRIKTLPTVASVRATLARVQQIVAEYPNDQPVLTAATPAVNHLVAIGNAEQELSRGNFETVLSLCAPYLEEDSRHIVFNGLKSEAEARLRVAYIKDLREHIGKQSSLEARVRLLEEAVKRYPSETWVADELQVIRNRLSLLDSTIEKARAAEAGGEWDEALEQWSRVPAVHGAYPNLDAEIARVRAARARAQEEKAAQWVRQVSERIGAGDLRGAGELLRQALSELPGPASLEALSKQLEELRQKRKRAQDLLSRARKALSTDPEMAYALVTEAAAIDAGVTPSPDLLNSIAVHRKKVAIDQALSDVEQQRASGNLRDAVSKIEGALREYPGEHPLENVLDSLTIEIHRKRESIINELGRMKEAAGQELSIANLQALRVRAFEIGQDTHLEEDLKSRVAANVLALDASIKRLKRLHVWGEIAARRKPVAAVAGVLVFVVVGWFIFAPILHSMREIPVKIASPGGPVSVQVGGKRCTTPDCDINLKPGTYTVTASQIGYQPLQRALKVTPDQPFVPLPLALEPLSEILQVNTNFSVGQVWIDGLKAGELSNGGFSKIEITPAEHTIQITGRDLKFSAKWKSRRGAAPVLTAPLVATDLIATVVAAVSTKGTMESTYVAQPVKIDGTQTGQTSATPGAPSEVQLVKEGLRKMEIGGRVTSLEVRPNPSLTFDLALDLNVGTLVVETKLDANVYVDNRPYRTTSSGVLRLPLDVGKYTVRVQKSGFQMPPAQTAELTKGKETNLTFSLVAIPPTVLELKGVMAGADISVDGQSKGQVGVSQDVHIEGLPAGNHFVELSMSGYTSARASFTLSDGGTKSFAGTDLPMSKLPSPPDPEADAWARIKNSSDPSDLDNFVKQFPQSTHVKEAEKQAAQLRQAASEKKKQEDDRRAAEAQSRQKELENQKEDDAWGRIKSSKDEAAVKAFLLQYPNGRHVKDAQAALVELKKDQDAALEKERIAQQQRDKDAVNAVLKVYAAAFVNKSRPDVLKVYPGAPIQAIEGEFRFAKAGTIQADLQPKSDIVIEGESATVGCVWTLAFTSTPDNAKHRVNTSFRVTLTRQGSTWVIKEMVKP